MPHVQTRVTSTLVTKPERDHPHDPILDVIAEFSETFSFIRTRWTEFTEQLHPELSGGSIFVLQVIIDFFGEFSGRTKGFDFFAHDN